MDYADPECERRLARQCSAKLRGNYEEPPLPPPCRAPISLAQRFALMHRRFVLGYQVIHPEDSWVVNDDRKGGQVIRTGRNGSVYAAEMVNNG